MKLKPVAMGNALGGATAILFALCAILVYSARDFGISVFKSIFHSIDVSPLTTTPKAFDFGSFALGWVAMAIFMWAFGWVLATVYNASAGRRDAP